MEPILLLGLTALGALALTRPKVHDRSYAPTGDGSVGGPDDAPARALTTDDATALLRQYEQNKVVTIESFHDVTVGGATSHRVTLGSSVGGVLFTYLDQPRKINDVDVRFAVFLVRLAEMLRDDFQVSVLKHLGIYPGGGGLNDCHNQGRALDFAGVRSSMLGDVDVLRDWGQQPAPYDVATATTTVYRLPDTDPNAALFRAVYDFSARQCSDRTTDYTVEDGVPPMPPTRIGDHSFVIHPDHPDRAIRPAHQNHVHVQIGPTNLR